MISDNSQSVYSQPIRKPFVFFPIENRRDIEYVSLE